MKSIHSLLFAAVLGLSLTGCTQNPANRNAGGEVSQLTGRLTLTGSSTVAPLATEIAKRFEELHPGVRVDVQTGGSGNGIADARAGVADIGMVSRALKPDEADLISHQIAADGVGLIVHNFNTMIAATLVTSLGAIMVAAPLGIASAVFVRFYAPSSLAIWYRRFIELLAGIPSVVFGLWGLVVLAPIVAQLGGSGQNLLTATIVLGLMVLPTVAMLSDGAIGSVPRDRIHGAAALGMQRWAIVGRVVLPGARRGIGAGVMLALTRALGETMAVLMLAGNIVEMPTSLLSPGRTLNANIALELGYASASHRSALFFSGLILMLVVSLIVVGVSRWEGRSNERG